MSVLTSSTEQIHLQLNNFNTYIILRSVHRTWPNNYKSDPLSFFIFDLIASPVKCVDTISECSVQIICVAFFTKWLL